MNEIYEITKDTCALIPKGADTTEIIETEQSVLINKPILTVLKESCEYYGSTLEGRIQGSKSQLGMCYKLPITIEAANELVFLPTNSPYKKDCCWIALNHIKHYEPIENNSLITFPNNHQHLFHISVSSLENQIFRATKLLLLMRSRIKQKK